MVKRQKETSYSIEWVGTAKNNFFEAVAYIAEYSLQGAGFVIDAVTKALDKAAANPEINPPDKWKNNNPGTYRAFEVKNFRIAYKIFPAKKLIKIIKFRHVKRYPNVY